MAGRYNLRNVPARQEAYAHMQAHAPSPHASATQSQPPANALPSSLPAVQLPPAAPNPDATIPSFIIVGPNQPPPSAFIPRPNPTQPASAPPPPALPSLPSQDVRKYASQASATTPGPSSSHVVNVASNVRNSPVMNKPSILSKKSWAAENSYRGGEGNPSQYMSHMSNVSQGHQHSSTFQNTTQPPTSTCTHAVANPNPVHVSPGAGPSPTRRSCCR